MTKTPVMKIRKGYNVYLDGTVVRVTKREKWNSKLVRISFEDCGNGLPQSLRPEGYINMSFAYFEISAMVDVVETK